MRSVLIVEDDAFLRMTLSTVLSDQYRVHAVASGLEALRYLREHSVDIVLLDLMMAEGDGVSVLNQMGTLNSAPRVIIHSAMSEAERIAKLIRLGASDYLVKPCPAEKVRNAIERALAERMAEMRPQQRPAQLLSA